jgi:hypothetical protein
LEKVERKRSGQVGEWYDMSCEVHWYEAHGIGAKEFKIKRILEIQ